MLTFLRLTNVVLIFSIIGCILGTLAGLIVFVPFLAGAWVLNAIALVGYEEAERPGWIERMHAASKPAVVRASSPVASPVRADSLDDERRVA